jgi:uncharacterized protein (TIGR02145 family)
LFKELVRRDELSSPAIFNFKSIIKKENFFMNRNIWEKMILRAAGAAIFTALFCAGCEDNGVTVVTPDVSTFTDGRDDKIYKKVQIGSQIWMAENLNYAADGSKCYEGYGHGGWSAGSAEGNCEKFGRLYDWNTAMNGEHSSHAVPSDVEGVCPIGWHLPSDAEWTVLQDFVGINAGTKLKSREWHDTHAPGGTPDPDGTDKYRFTALPGGYAGASGSGSHAGWNGFWWTATETESDENQGWYREILGTQTGVSRNHFEKHYYLSVRCVHD